jgi:hypothetical protein
VRADAGCWEVSAWIGDGVDDEVVASAQARGGPIERHRQG